MAINIASILVPLRRAVALPIYALAQIMSYSAELLGALAAKMAGDDWPK
jgi:hypothetical protein